MPKWNFYYELTEKYKIPVEADCLHDAEKEAEAIYASGALYSYWIDSETCSWSTPNYDPGSDEA